MADRLLAAPPTSSGSWKRANSISSSTSIFRQVGAIEALKHGDALIRHMVAEYFQRRSLMMEMVDAYPVFLFPSPGAFISGFTTAEKDGRMEMVDLLLEKTAGHYPGEIFGPSGKATCASLLQLAEISGKA